MIRVLLPFLITIRSHARAPLGARSVMGTVFLACLIAGSADAREELIEWDYSDRSSIAGFEILVGSSSRIYGDPIDVVLASESGGVFFYTLTVPDDQPAYIAVRAYASDGRTSPLSNERFRPALGGGGGEPVAIPAPPSAFTPAGDVVFDFEMAPEGNTIQDWFATGANNSLVSDDSLFGVEVVEGNHVLYTNSSLTSIHSHYVGSDAENWSAYELRGAMLVTSASSGIGVTVHSQYPSADSYFRLRRHGNGSFEVSPHSSGSGCGDVDTGVTPEVGVWYRFSLAVVGDSSSHSIEAKVWRDGDSEPATPQAVCVDTSSTRPLAGTVGVWSMGDGSKYWAIFDVSGGSVVPVPPNRPEPPVLLDP